MNKAKQKTICDDGAPYTEDNITVEKIAINDEIEEIRKAQKAMIQKNIANIPTAKSKAKITAIAVATPLPPLKFK